METLLPEKNNAGEEGKENWEEDKVTKLQCQEGTHLKSAAFVVYYQPGALCEESYLG